jgi:hypothetical protein
MPTLVHIFEYAVSGVVEAHNWIRVSKVWKEPAREASTCLDDDSSYTSYKSLSTLNACTCERV